MVNKKLIKKLNRFIKRNKLEFEDGSGNSMDLVILCGYALSINDGERATEELEIVLEPFIKENSDLEKQFRRVETFSFYKDYGDWWKEEKNSSQYRL